MPAGHFFAARFCRIVEGATIGRPAMRSEKLPICDGGSRA
jgi:hypothetical protein